LIANGGLLKLQLQVVQHTAYFALNIYTNFTCKLLKLLCALDISIL